VQVVISWLLAFVVLNTRSDGVRAFAIALERLTAPIYRPIRAMLPDFGGLDFSPLVVLIAIQILRMLLGGAETSLTYTA
jgi:YggT family protein